jgi:hypothetical protein
LRSLRDDVAVIRRTALTRYFKRDSEEYSKQRPTWLHESLRSSGGTVSGLPMFVMGGDAESWDAPAGMTLEMAPGYVLFRHGHDCYRFEMILEGSLHTEEGAVLTAGDVMVARPHEMYGPHTAGPEGCTTLEMFSSVEGVYRIRCEGPDGPELIDTRRGQRPYGYVDMPGQEVAAS